MYLQKKWRIFQPALAFSGVNTLHPIPASWHPNPQPHLGSCFTRVSEISSSRCHLGNLQKTHLCLAEFTGRSKADVGEISWICVCYKMLPLCFLKKVIFGEDSCTFQKESIYLSICLSVCLSVYLSIYLSIYLPHTQSASGPPAGLGWDPVD